MQPTGRTYQTDFNKLLIDMILKLYNHTPNQCLLCLKYLYTHGLVLRCDFKLCREEQLTADYIGELHGELIPTV